MVLALDSHAHCGLTLPFIMLHSLWEEGKIAGGVLFSPVEEIYDRYNRKFIDSQYYRESRQRVHNHLESLISGQIFVYWFVWNDFAPPGDCFTGIKWHRHPGEPEYLYGTKECENFIETVCSLQLPVVLEEEFHHTLKLAERIDRRTVIIIPHMGGLNGGYYRLKQAGLFENPAVYVDTALAGEEEIIDFAGDYGVSRILFGSDYPFGDPSYERYKLERAFSGKELKKILAQNLLELLGS
jgi:hypothetical protein